MFALHPKPCLHQNTHKATTHNQTVVNMFTRFWRKQDPATTARSADITQPHVHMCNNTTTTNKQTIVCDGKHVNTIPLLQRDADNISKPHVWVRV